MTNLTQLQFNSQQVRIVLIDNNPWFVATDLIKILELDNTALRRLKDYEKGKDTINTPGGKQELVIISESGLYRLVLTSRKPQAEPFQDWVCQEVLPSIRKTGSYTVEQPKKNIYAHRVQIASQWDIPKGHWCVFHEISLLANKVGEQYPVQEYDLIDGSVGKCWANYRKTQPWALPHTTFNVIFNDRRDIAHIEANAYRNEELFYFREWLENIYRATNMPKYLLKKYGAIIKA